MKKLLLYLIFIGFILIMNGCFHLAKLANLTEVKFYDSENNEIQGEVRDYFGIHDRVLTESAYYRRLNSPRPVENFYVAKAEEGSSIKVVMKFSVKKGYVMNLLAMYLQNNKEETADITNNIEADDDGFTYITYNIENLTSDNNFYEIAYWTDNKDVKRTFSSNNGEYLLGFHLIFDNHNTIPA